MKNLITILAVAALLFSFSRKGEEPISTGPEPPIPVVDDSVVVVEPEPTVIPDDFEQPDFRLPDLPDIPGYTPYPEPDPEPQPEPDPDPIPEPVVEPVQEFVAFPLKGGEDWRVTYYSKTSGDGQDYVITDGFDLRPQGKVPIAYLSAHYEKWRRDNKAFNLRGSRNLGRWKNEKYIKWYLPDNMEVMRDRIQMVKAKGYVGIDWDNVDGPGGVEHFIWLATETKKAGLYCGLKNAVEYLPILRDRGLLDDLVDFVVSESRGKKEQVVYEKYGLFGVHMSKGEPTYPPLSRAVRQERGNRYD